MYNIRNSIENLINDLLVAFLLKTKNTIRNLPFRYFNITFFQIMKNKYDFGVRHDHTIKFPSQPKQEGTNGHVVRICRPTTDIAPIFTMLTISPYIHKPPTDSQHAHTHQSYKTPYTRIEACFLLARFSTLAAVLDSAIFTILTFEPDAAAQKFSICNSYANRSRLIWPCKFNAIFELCGSV